MSTLKMTDEVGYQVLQDQNPVLLERVKQALARNAANNIW